jgi:EAL domain-containing protein (putative c-di-GMP-specific phosphodiesterase class I)
VGSPEHTSAEDQVRDAEEALHRAKAQGKARHELFDAHMRVQALRRLSVENELRRAVDRGEFRVHYQPIVSLHTGRITGFEALVRWEAPDVGLLPPAEFIGIAEEIGLIGAIGRWVMREACRQARAWQEQFPLTPPLVISVNVSGREFREGGLADHVAAVIEETGLDPTCLKLEITESAILDDTQAVSAVLDRLRAMRVQLSLDDFGTGYSSLSYLHRYPFDALKVDRAFITRLGPDGANGAIVHAILALGRSFDLEVVAEGIETAEQYAQLRSGGCGYGQGYFFSEPLDASAAEALLTTRPCW